MNPIFVLLLFLVLLIIFSQFGGKLSATSAWHWWLVAVFVMIAGYQPELYRPIAALLGIRFISNFVLAALVMFLFMQGLSSQASIVALSRKHRQFISTEAVKRYLIQSKITAKKILIILPTYNEQDNIAFMATELKKLADADSSMHFCFVNDGSTDETAAALKAVGQDYFLEHLTNINVSGVLRTGFELAHHLKVQFVVQCDADGQHPVSEIPRLVREAEKNNIDCLIGSRFVGETLSTRLQNKSTTILRVMGGQSLRWTLSLLFGACISDPTSGFRVYSAKAIEVLRKSIPDEYPEPESIAIMASKRLKLAETRVNMHARVTGTSSLGGWKSIAYMSKVISALLGLRIRSFVGS